MSYDHQAKHFANISEAFYGSVSKLVEKDDPLLLCFTHLKNFIMVQSKHFQNLSYNIQSELIEPFKTVLDNFTESNKKILTKYSEVDLL